VLASFSHGRAPLTRPNGITIPISLFSALVYANAIQREVTWWGSVRHTLCPGRWQAFFRGNPSFLTRCAVW
jgi:hypothetical protein